MKVYLDDERPTPEGWRGCHWPEEVIALLKTGQVQHLSLDHDLGECFTHSNPRTGYDVLTWIEEQVYTTDFVPPRHIVVHSANASATQKMKAAIRQIMLKAMEQGKIPKRG